MAGATQRPRSGMFTLLADTGTQLTLIRNGDLSRGGSVGGWQQSDRDLREAADWWLGRPKGTLSIPAMLDVREVGGPSVERRLQVLYDMGQASAEGDDPPALRIVGDVPAAAGHWKLDDISLGATLYLPDDPTALWRQELTLELSTFAPATGVDKVTVKRTRTAHGKRRTRIIHSRRGDTLRGIAVRQLGSSGDYVKIREWNPKLKRVDPDARLRANTKIVLR